MNQASDIPRRLFAAALAALVLTLSVAQPVLGEADLGNQATVETQHDQGECPQGHDHTICTQLGANHASPAVTSHRVPDRPVAQMVHANHFVAPVLAALRDGNQSRAPPLD